MMKKTLTMIAVAAIALFVLIGCSDDNSAFNQRFEEASSDGAIHETSRLTPLAHVNGGWYLIVHPYDFGDAATTVTLEAATGSDITASGNGSVRTDALVDGRDYILTVTRDGESVTAAINFTAGNGMSHEYGLFIDGERQLRDSTYFEVFLGERSLGEFQSLYQAIDATFRRNGAVVVEHGLRTVFIRNEPDAIYLFQHTRYIGTVFNEDEAQEFLDTYRFSMAMKSNGAIFHTSYEFHQTSNHDGPDPWKREAYSGGYVYRVAYAYQRPRGASVTINLSEAMLRNADNNTHGNGFNAYIFFAVQNSEFTIDMGIMHGWLMDGNWHVFTMIPDDMPSYGIITTSEYIDGTWHPNDDINIHIRLWEGRVRMVVTNLTTNDYIVAEVEHYLLGGSTTFTMGTSFVPAFEEGRTFDLRNGGYFRNIIYRDSYLYWPGETLDSYTSVPYWLGGPSTYYIIVYGDDTCQIEFVRDSNGDVIGEIIHIDYRIR